MDNNGPQTTAPARNANSLVTAKSEFADSVILAQVVKNEENCPTAAEGSDESSSSIVTLSLYQTLFRFATFRAKLMFSLGAIFAVANGCIYPALAIIYSEAFVDLSGPDDTDLVSKNMNIVVTFIVSGFIALVAATLQTYCFEIFSINVTSNIRTTLFNSLLSNDLSFFDTHDVSELSTTIEDAGALYRKATGLKFGMGIQFTTNLIGGLGVAFYANWKVTLVCLATIPFIGGSASWVVKINTEAKQAQTASYGRAGAVAEKVLRNLRTVLTLPGSLEKFALEYFNFTDEAKKSGVKRAINFGVANGSMMASFILMYVILTLYGVHLLAEEVQKSGCDVSGAVFNNKTCSITGADVFTAMLGVAFGGQAMGQISAFLEGIGNAKSSMGSLWKLLDESQNNFRNIDSEKRAAGKRASSVVVTSLSNAGSNVGGAEIVFSNVNFTYPSRLENRVLKGLNLQIPSSTSLAICGSSGCGKSTIASLLQRFYDVDEGSVTIDGKDVREMDVRSLRNQIAVIQQEPILFDVSIKKNIMFGGAEGREITMEMVENAAKLANCYDFIQEFPEKFETKCGSGSSVQLSGGQKQRVCIARAIINNSRIIILDEATSALDNQSERLVQDALNNMMSTNSVTSIIIAHRLTTIRSADNIAVLKNGNVAEYGTHNDLMTVRNEYYNLVSAQQSDSAEGGTVGDPRLQSQHPHESSSDLVNLASSDEQPIVQFLNVDFTYPTRQNSQVLKRFSMSVMRGETLAIAGGSGCGKSTIISLVNRFYDVDSGKVLIDGVNIRSQYLGDLRKKISLVSQEPILFNTTIAENIRMGKSDATLEEIVAAAKSANAHDFITEFENGYDTNIGQTTQVSGGQKQRICIARAIISDPEILLLDEATSALDTASEAVVQEALDKLMRDRTTIVVAHRLSTIKNADKICCMKNGRSVEIGTHSQLMELDSHYAGLVHARLLTDTPSADASKEPANDLSVMKDPGKDTDEDAAKNDDDDEKKKISKIEEKELVRSCWRLVRSDWFFIALGISGAMGAGAVFPLWGIMFALMIDLLFAPVLFCDVSLPNQQCQSDWNEQADSLRDDSYEYAMWWGLLCALALVGYFLLGYGSGKASERLSKRIRDTGFISLIRQEVGFHDVNGYAVTTAQLSEDATLLKHFTAEPINTLAIAVCSALVGLVVR
mgnify:CR=1 FL=1